MKCLLGTDDLEFGLSKVGSTASSECLPHPKKFKKLRHVVLCRKAPVRIRKEAVALFLTAIMSTPVIFLTFVVQVFVKSVDCSLKVVCRQQFQTCCTSVLGDGNI